MEQDNINQNQLSPQNTSNLSINSVDPNISNQPTPKSNRLKLIYLSLIILFILGLMVAFFIFVGLLNDHAQVNKAIFNQINSRKNVNNLKNVFGNGKFASGFLSNKLFTKNSKSPNYFGKVYAQNIQPHPFIFYPLGLKVYAYDLQTNENSVLLDLSTNQDISTKSGAQLDKMYFLNNSKQIVYFLRERVDNQPDEDDTIINDLERYKMSINIYNPETKTTKQIISAVISGASVANWTNPNISPDEKYLFFLYNNQDESDDPFAKVLPANDNKNYSSESYFFYNFQTDSLTSFKLDFPLAGGGNVLDTWDQESKFILLSFTNTKTHFVKVFPDKQSETITDTDNLLQFDKIIYSETENKLYYIAYPDADTTDSKFGYYDLTTKLFSTVTPQGSQSSIFNFDYTNGYIYDTYNWLVNKNFYQPQNKSLNYYDITTKTSRKITDEKLTIINFDGDYSHLLVATYATTSGSQLFDLNTSNGDLNYLSTAPFRFSAWGTDIYPINETITPTPIISPEENIATPTGNLIPQNNTSNEASGSSR